MTLPVESLVIKHKPSTVDTNTMARPSGLPFHSMKPSTTSFTNPSSNYQQSSSSQTSRQHDLSFTSLPIDIPSQVTSDPSSNQQYPQSLLLDDSTSIVDDQLDSTQSATDLLQDFDALTSNPATSKHGSRVLSHEPWNSFNLVTNAISTQSKHSLPVSHQSKKRPHTDSGYASSQKSRQRISNNPQVDQSFEIPRSLPYNEPIGSAAQQHHFLFDQQRRPQSVVSSAPTKAASVAGDTSLTSSGQQLIRCEECAETFNTKSEMSKHMNRHNKKHVCDVPGCSRATEGFGFATKNDLDRHKGSVHRDQSVARKEFKCRVLNCKDPNKIWDRKDNFKAHVKRMHPEVDPDKVVDASYVKPRSVDTSAESERALNLARSQQDFNLTGYGPTAPSLQGYYAPSSVAETPFNNPDPFGEGDMYEASPTPIPRSQPYPSQLDPRSYPNVSYMGPSNFLAPTAAGPHAYPQSNTMVASSSAQESMPPLFAHRMNMTPATFYNAPFTTNRGRPLDAQTAPPMGQVNDEFRTRPLLDSYQSGDTSSLAESNLGAIDPSLQLTQSGSWLPSPSTNYPQQADIADPPLPSNLTVSTAEPSTTDAAQVNKRCDAVEEAMKEILEKLSPDQMKTVIDMYKNHPSVPNKEVCSLKIALDAFNDPTKRPFKCSRAGCYKTFTQNNIRKKHEKRHDRLFFCTFDGCYSVFGTKDDLRRHEFGKHLPQHFQGWRCFPDDVPTSQHKLDCFKFFENKELFKQHRREMHHERAEKNNGDLKAVKLCHAHQVIPGHFWCGFCNMVILNEPNGTDGTKQNKFRYDHLDLHITKEKKTMNQWIDLQSEGLTKTEAKLQHTDPTTNDGSDEEEEVDQPSPAEISATVGASSSFVPARSNQERLGGSIADGRNRKRAHSDAEYNSPFPVKAPRKNTYQQSGAQAQMMSRGSSDLPASGSSLLQPQVSRQPQPSVTWVQCCQCKNKRYVKQGESCGQGGCFHARCRNCVLFDNMSNPINYKSPTGHGHGGGA